MNNFYRILTIVLITISQSVFAVEPTKADGTFFEEAMKPTSPPLAKIEKVLREYANTVGCDFSMNRKNIVEIDIDKDENEEKEFVAIFNIDAGCLGGSGTGKSSVAVLKYRDIFHKDIIYVRAELSEPSVASYGFPKLIERLFIKNGQLWYAGKINKDGDANNLPTSSVQGQINLIKKEISINSSQFAPVFYWKSSKDYAR